MLTNDEHIGLGLNIGLLEDMEEQSKTMGLGALSPANSLQMLKEEGKHLCFAEKKAMANVFQQAAGQSSLSRKNFMDRIGQLPKDVQNLIKSGTLNVSDYVVYSTKNILATDSVVRIIDVSDTQAIGVTNLQNGKLEQGYYFVPSFMSFVFTVSVATLAVQERVYFASNFSDPYLNGAEIEIILNTQWFLKNFPLGTYFTQACDFTKGLNFCYALDNPKMFTPLDQIKLSMSFASMPSAPAHIVTGVRCMLIGSALIPR